MSFYSDFKANQTPNNQGIPRLSLLDFKNYNKYSPTHTYTGESKAKSKCYVIRNDTNEKFTFQYNPTSVPYSRSAKYSTIESPGMSYPLTQYTGGSAREFSFELFYYDNPFTGKINTARKFLEGLLPPETNKEDFTKPPSFTFAYGYFVRTLVLVSLEVKDEWLDENGQPLMTRFNLSVRQVGL